jgi:hypothetical protein
METAILAVLCLQVLATLVLVVLVLKRRATLAPPVDTHGERLARASLAYARQTFPEATGDVLLRHALATFRELDLSEDGKRDFSDRQAGMYLRAVL